MTCSVTSRSAAAALSAAIAAETDANDHTGALILLADHFGTSATDKIAAALRALRDEHLEIGHLSGVLRARRDAAFENLKVRAAGYFTREDCALVLSAF
jgi:hypothetical protein